jgi:hypothetical protein
VQRPGILIPRCAALRSKLRCAFTHLVGPQRGIPVIRRQQITMRHRPRPLQAVFPSTASWRLFCADIQHSMQTIPFSCSDPGRPAAHLRVSGRCNMVASLPGWHGGSADALCEIEDSLHVRFGTQRFPRWLVSPRSDRPTGELGDPSRIRTCNPRSRNPLLYPVELWDRNEFNGLGARS